MPYFNFITFEVSNCPSGSRWNLSNCTYYRLMKPKFYHLIPFLKYGYAGEKFEIKKKINTTKTSEKTLIFTKKKKILLVNTLMYIKQI